MTVKTTTLNLNTSGNADIKDLTEEIARAVLDSGLRDGTVTVFCPPRPAALRRSNLRAGRSAT